MDENRCIKIDLQRKRMSKKWRLVKVITSDHTTNIEAIFRTRKSKYKKSFPV